VPETWHSPRSRSALVAAAPARLAEEYDGNVLWHEATDGTLEVAALKDGRLTRHLVHQDGTTTVTASFDPSAGYRLGGPLTWVGFALCASMVILGAVGEAIGSSDWTAAVIFPGFILGMIFVWVGGTMRANRSNVGWLIKRLGERPAEWHMPPQFHGWQPTSSQQLAAMEELAAAHDDGVAYVRDNGGAMIEALVLRKRRVDSYWIDRLGNVGLSETLPSRFPGTWSLARRVRKLPDASAWIEIRTRPEPSNDA
jgi:hypothetical protein